MVIKDLNPILRGWGYYFRWGNSARKLNAIDSYVHERLARLDTTDGRRCRAKVAVRVMPLSRAGRACPRAGHGVRGPRMRPFSGSRRSTAASTPRRWRATRHSRPASTSNPRYRRCRPQMLALYCRPFAPPVDGSLMSRRRPIRRSLATDDAHEARRRKCEGGPAVAIAGPGELDAS
jgi:hypothetical protein